MRTRAKNLGYIEINVVHYMSTEQIPIPMPVPSSMENNDLLTVRLPNRILLPNFVLSKGKLAPLHSEEDDNYATTVVHV